MNTGNPKPGIKDSPTEEDKVHVGLSRDSDLDVTYLYVHSSCVSRNVERK